MLGGFDDGIEFGAGVFEGGARGFVGVEEKLTEGREVLALEVFDGLADAGNFGDNMFGALGGFGVDEVAVLCELFPGDVSEGGDGVVEMLVKLGGGFFAAFSAFVVGRFGQRVFDVGVDHDETGFCG